RDFLDALVALGMLERDDTDPPCYRNTVATECFLDPARPTYLGGLLEMLNSRLYGFWGSLTDALRTGLPQNELKDGGEDVFAALYADPVGLAGFLAAMSGISAGIGVALADTFDWGRRRSFCDLGTAQGMVPV